MPRKQPARKAATRNVSAETAKAREQERELKAALRREKNIRQLAGQLRRSREATAASIADLLRELADDFNFELRVPAPATEPAAVERSH